MTPEKIEGFLIDFKEEMAIKLTAIETTLLKSVEPDICEIKNHLKTQNHRIEKEEKRNDRFDTELKTVKNAVENTASNCAKIQEAKAELAAKLEEKKDKARKEAEEAKEKTLDNRHKRIIRIISLIGLCITIITAANGIFNGGTRVKGRAAYNRIEAEIDSLDSKVKEGQRIDSILFRDGHSLQMKDISPEYGFIDSTLN